MRPVVTTILKTLQVCAECSHAHALCHGSRPKSATTPPWAAPKGQNRRQPQRGRQRAAASPEVDGVVEGSQLSTQACWAAPPSPPVWWWLRGIEVTKREGKRLLWVPGIQSRGGLLGRRLLMRRA